LGEGWHDVGVTAGSQIAVLRYRRLPDSEGGSARLRFDTRGVKQVGQYSGTLQIRDKSVDLSYLKARSVWFAVLMILVGLAAAIWRQIWTSSVRPVRRADERLTLVGKDALDRQAKYEQRARTASYRVYDLVTGVAPEVARLQTQLGALRGWLHCLRLGSWE
jgi:hypothetical protein